MAAGPDINAAREAVRAMAATLGLEIVAFRYKEAVGREPALVVTVPMTYLSPDTLALDGGWLVSLYRQMVGADCRQMLEILYVYSPPEDETREGGDG